jgi:restriction endonuclease Mrr
MMPKQREMELPLLRVLKDHGGKAKAQDVYKEISKLFPALTEEDAIEELPSGGNKWTNRIQWVRQQLLDRGEVASAGHGIWEITSQGLARLNVGDKIGTHLSQTSSPELPQPPGGSTFEESVDDYLDAFKAKVLQKLLDLPPTQFEEFAGLLLKSYGFQKIAITGKAGDGGIDGHGQLKVGMASVNAAFQCKRWQGSVGSKEVQAFRGAIQGQFEQGYFFSTSTFTKAAQAESIKVGAAPVILFEGQQIVEIMLEKGIGVRRRPVEIYEDQLETLFEK